MWFLSFFFHFWDDSAVKDPPCRWDRSLISADWKSHPEPSSSSGCWETSTPRWHRCWKCWFSVAVRLKSPAMIWYSPETEHRMLPRTDLRGTEWIEYFCNLSQLLSERHLGFVRAAAMSSWWKENRLNSRFFALVCFQELAPSAFNIDMDSQEVRMQGLFSTTFTKAKSYN